MARFIIFIDKLIYLYLCFIMITGLISWVPNINPDYPLFNFMFKASGFYLFPPVMGILLSPVVVMLVCALISFGLKKIYQKYYTPKTPEILVVSAEQFIEHMNEINKEKEKEDVSD